MSQLLQFIIAQTIISHQSSVFAEGCSAEAVDDDCVYVRGWGVLSDAKTAVCRTSCSLHITHRRVGGVGETKQGIGRETDSCGNWLLGQWSSSSLSRNCKFVHHLDVWAEWVW